MRSGFVEKKQDMIVVVHPRGPKKRASRIKKNRGADAQLLSYPAFSLQIRSAFVI